MWAIIVLFILVPFAIAGASLAPWVPTNSRDLQRVQKILWKKRGSRFLEFGCGDGRVSHFIAKNNPDMEVVGIELALPIFCMAKIRQLISPLPNLKIELGSGFKKDFWDFDIIYLFGMPESIAKKILPKFESEARKGTQLISYVFSFKDIEGDIQSHTQKDQKALHVLTR